MFTQNYWLNDGEEEDNELIPHCANCGYEINEEHYWKIDGEVLCDSCAKAMYRKDTDEYEYEGD